MTETLLSVSEVLLFGRVIEDIEFVPLESKKFIAAAASTDKVSDFKGTSAIDGQAINAKDHVLVAVPKKDNPNAFKTNGLYYVNDDANNTWTRLILPKGALVKVPNGNNNSGVWRQKKSSASKQKFVNIERKKNGAKRQGLGNNRHLDSQLDEDAHFARIYGFTYEGAYYELPDPTVFLVHGDGEPARPESGNTGADAHSPLNPSASGVASADYQVSDGIRTWNYDKADYTIRMDMMTGMIEQVLLDVYFSVEGPMISGAKVSGAKVSGAKVSGAKVSGAKVSGAKVSGAKVSGAKARGD